MKRLVWLGIVLSLSSCVLAPRPKVTGDLPHFLQVDETLYRGGQPTEEGFQRLATLGIKTVVSFRLHDEGDLSEREISERLGMRWVNIPFHSSQTPSEAQIQQFFDVVLDPANQPLFVHCYEGKNRTGMLLALYRIVHDGWEGEEALEEALRLGLNQMHLPARRMIVTFPEKSKRLKRP